MKLIEGEVVLAREVGPGIQLLRFSAPDIARDAGPGQFVHVRCAGGNDPFLRRPISLMGVGKSSSLRRSDGALELRQGEIDLLFARVGRGTTALAGARPGDTVSLLGPLGRGFTIDPKTRNLLLVAGGMGFAPLAYLAAEAIRHDLTVTVLCGSRSDHVSLPPWLLPPEAEYAVCTEDGSAGRKGIVTGFVPELLEWADEVFACGPRAMLSALAHMPRLKGVPVQVSLEERMACGVGACLGCVVRTRRGMKRVCRDGPVFDLWDLTWE